MRDDSAEKLPLWAAVLTLLLLGLTAYNALVAHTGFIDNLYNLGLIRHSAATAPFAHPLLETSQVNMFFDFRPLPHAERWHRGAAGLLSAWLGALSGNTSDWFLRLPHWLWLLAWLALSGELAYRVGDPAPGRTRVWPLTAAALVLTPWSLDLQQDAFVDDVPALVCALAALLALSRRRSVGAAAAAGALLGLAALMKDFYLLWGGLGGALVVGLSVWGAGRRAWRAHAAQAAAFSAGFGLLLAVKFGWAWHDFGRILDNPVTHYLRAGFFGRPPVDGLYPFFILAPDVAYQSRLALAGGVGPALRALVEPIVLVGGGIQLLAFAAIWLLPLAWGGVPHRRRAGQVLLSALALSATGYALFFAAGLGQGNETRYWAVPVTVLVVLGSRATLGLAARGVLPPWRSAPGAALALVFVLLYVQPARYVYNLRSAEPVHGAAVMAYVADRNPPDQAILTDTRGGALLYSRHPLEHIVAFPTYHLNSFTPDQAARLFDAYAIHWALLDISDAVNWQTLERLRQWGWQVDYADDWDVVLRRPPVAD